MDQGRRLYQKVNLIVVTIFVLLILFYAWFKLFGAVFGILGLLILVFFSIKKIIFFFLFPGFFTIWRRFTNLKLESELTLNFLSHLQDLKNALEVLIKDPSNASFLSQNSKNIKDSKFVISAVTSNYNKIDFAQLSTNQLYFKNILDSINKELLETIVIFPNNSENLWKVFDNPSIYNWSNITFEDFPENISLKNALEHVNSLERFLLPLSEIKVISGIFKDPIFTNLNVLKELLFSTYHCENCLVTSYSGVIDSIIIKNPSKSTDSPIILFCNPNAGIYEFACYQNQWVDFYLSLGIDLCIWNYRGYGKNQGTPSADLLRADVQAMYNFLLTEKLYTKIGVHGESLGAMPACYLASSNEVQFLFADRTFASVETLVRIRIGKINKGLFKCLTNWQDYTAENFIQAKCYKIVTCDCNDVIIPDMASLKIGIVAREVFHETEEITISEFFKAIRSAHDLVKQYRAKEMKESFEAKYALMNKESKFIATEGNHHNTTYIAVGKEADAIEEEIITSILYKLYNALDIDAGGVYLYTVKTQEELKNWIKVLQAWGSLLPLKKNANSRQESFEKLETSFNILSEIIKENEFNVSANIVHLCREAHFLRAGIFSLQKCLKSHADDVFDIEKLEKDLQSTGRLVPLRCGHNGLLNKEEQDMVQYHLRRSKFIN